MTINLIQKRITAFQEEILDWYARNRRDLPWRKSRDPYLILVSEIMLQQTQVTRVIPKYEAWMRAFPTVTSLAKAKTSEILRLWSGLGYNRRALYLQRAAQGLNELRSKKYELRNDGNENDFWPRTPEELEKLPGIGTYTARAVACFAFDQQVAVVDTNIRKVILIRFGQTNNRHPGGSSATERISKDSITSLRSFQNDKNEIASRPFAMTDKQVQEIADTLLPEGQAYEWNQALMDYASAMLKKEKIPIPKQSRFQGSNRYYRGKMLRLLLEKETVQRSEVGILLKPDFSATDDFWLQTLLKQMEKDGFIRLSKEMITLL